MRFPISKVWSSFIVDIIYAIVGVFLFALLWRMFIPFDGGGTLLITLIATSVAGFAGTWGAQYVIERRFIYKEMKEEVIALNKALSIIGISHGLLMEKRSSFHSFYKEYYIRREKFIKSGNSTKSTRLTWRKFSGFPLPVNSLVEVIDENLYRDSKLIMSAEIIKYQYQSLIDLFNFYNELTDNLSAIDTATQQERKKKYLRYFSVEDGFSDVRFKGVLDSINDEFDKILYFIHLIRSRLEDYYSSMCKHEETFMHLHPLVKLDKISKDIKFSDAEIEKYKEYFPD